MARMVLGETLVLTLTRACNLRCGFCPLTLYQAHMSLPVARRAIEVYRERFPGAARVRFFGGEPLLRFSLLRRLIDTFPREYGMPKPSFSFPTNGTLFNDAILEYLRARPDVEAVVSRVHRRDALLALPNLLINICIPPQGASWLAGYMTRLLRAGFRRFNFLPAYFVHWTTAELAALKRSFAMARELIVQLRDRGTRVEIRNLSTANPTPLFNHGMVVDVEGDVFPSNAALSAPFARLRGTLRLGSVLKPEAIRWDLATAVRWEDACRECLDPEVAMSTSAVDAILSEFVHRLPAETDRCCALRS